MTRYVITLGTVGLTSGSGNNLGSTLLLAQGRGRIKAVQFALVGQTDIGTAGEASSYFQLSKAPNFSSAAPFNGLNPVEVAAVVLAFQNDDTATQSRLVTTDAQIVIPCDTPLEIGESLFVNAQDLGGSAQIGTVTGIVVVFVE